MTQIPTTKIPMIPDCPTPNEISFGRFKPGPLQMFRIDLNKFTSPTETDCSLTIPVVNELEEIQLSILNGVIELKVVKKC
jgi:hypothetical protein